MRAPGAVLAAGVLLALLAGAGADAPLLVAVGDATPTSAVVWVRAAGAAGVDLDYGPEGRPPAARATLPVGPRTDFTGKVRLEGLQAATAYAYRVRAGDRTRDGRFTTAPAAGDARPVRFLWSGDQGCRPASGYRVYEALARHRPHFFLLVGDTTYADVVCAGPEEAPGADFVATTLEGYRARHRHTREDPAVAGFLAGTVVYAIWDDHEVRNDFAGSVEPLMPVGRAAFLDYWPIVPPAEEPGRLYRRFRWGRLLEVFILDTRQYRSPNHQPDGPGKTMLGRRQRDWLIAGVTTSTATWKVVVSSMPLAVPKGAPRDGWSSAAADGTPGGHPTGFATERDAILGALRDRGVRNLVVVAADVHYAQLIRHHPAPGFSLHEFVAGPLAAPPARPGPLDRSLGPRSLFARGGLATYGEVVVEPGVLTVRILDAAGQELFRHLIGPE